MNDIDDLVPYIDPWENQREYSCGKRKYTRKDAETMKNHLKKKGKLLRIYQCPECGGFHLTHKNV